jgi:hypothetical protein
MRYAYIKVGNGKNGCRGGVKGQHGDGDYELEVGQSQNASTEMLALCAFYDEVMEYLKKADSPIGQLLFKAIRTETNRLSEEYQASVESDRSKLQLYENGAQEEL